MPALQLLLLTVLLVAPTTTRANDLIMLLQARSCPNCKLANADLVHADLSNADLRGAHLQRANLSQARLDGANLTVTSVSPTSRRLTRPQTYAAAANRYQFERNGSHQCLLDPALERATGLGHGCRRGTRSHFPSQCGD